MSPRKQPVSLFDCAVKVATAALNVACVNIEREHHEYEYPGCQRQLGVLKEYLMATLPSRLLDVLCAARRMQPLLADPRLQLALLLHPALRVFQKTDLDNGIPPYFWTDRLPALTRLVVLDLKLICTDEILETVGKNCPMLEEINAVSRVDLRKSPFNASVLIRNVSDAGIEHLACLKHLRVLSIDPPRNERLGVRVGRCISQNGIRRIVARLPSLEELLVESCDVGATLVAGEFNNKPLSLKKIQCHFASPESVQKLTTLCPALRDLSLTHLSDQNNDEILQRLGESEIKLNRLEFSFFSFTSAMKDLLRIKGCYITHFSLWENENILTLDSLLTIGRCCPNLLSFRISTQSKRLIPEHFRCSGIPLFPQLRSLSLGCDNFLIENVLLFFLTHSPCLTRLIVKYQTKTFLDDAFMRFLNAGLMNNLVFLWLDCTLVVTREVTKQIIDRCQHLNYFVVNSMELDTQLQDYVKANNYDVKIDNNY